VLRQLLADTGASAFRELVAGCRVELPALVAGGDSCRHARDLRRCAAEAHTIKGLALTFGLVRSASRPARSRRLATPASRAALRLVALIRERPAATLIALGRTVEATAAAGVTGRSSAFEEYRLPRWSGETSPYFLGAGAAASSSTGSG